MSDNKERATANIFNAAVSRPAGKRQIKPSITFFESEYGQAIINAGNDSSDEDDLDFNAHNQSDEGSGSDRSSASEEEKESGSDESTGGYESGSESGDKLELEGTGGKKKSKNLDKPKERINGLIYEDGDNELGQPKEGVSNQRIATNMAEPSTGQMCSICLNLKSTDCSGELVQCDKCGLLVHEACYSVNNEASHADSQSMSSSASTEPWFCEPCLFGNGTIPHCELCPSRFGAFKRADVPGAWVHLVCALFTPGVEFTDIDHISGISWQDIDYRTFGRKLCSGCTDKLEARTGIAVKCDAGLCKNYFHVTCAQKLGLLVENTQNHRYSIGAEKGYLYCLRTPTFPFLKSHYFPGKRHKHNELEVNRQKTAYAKFVREEERRMVEFKNVQLDSRQEKKWRAQLEERQKHANAPQFFQQKRAKFLHTSARNVNAFAEKAELLGLTRQHFEEEFANLAPSQLPTGLPPAFSKAFVGYVEHRDTHCIEEEEEHAAKAELLKAQLLESQAKAGRELKNVKSNWDGLAKNMAGKGALLEKLKSVVRAFEPSAIIESRKVERKRSLPKSHQQKTKADLGIEKKRRKRNSKSPLIDPQNGPKISAKSPSPHPSTSKIASLIPSSSSANQPDPQKSLPPKPGQSIPTFLFSRFGFNDKQSKSSQTSAKRQPSILKSSNSKLTPNGLGVVTGVDEGPPKECKKDNDPHFLIFCESCKQHYHIGCLDPPMEKMPARDKFSRFECSDCACPSGEDDDTAAKNPKEGGGGQPPEDWALTAMRTRRQVRTKH